MWSFFDDIKVGSEDALSYLKYLKEVLERIRISGMKLNIYKCKFSITSAGILGHVVDRHRIRPSDGHFEALRRMKEPSNGEELLRFLGVVQFLVISLRPLLRERNRYMPYWKGQVSKRRSEERAMLSWSEGLQRNGERGTSKHGLN